MFASLLLLLNMAACGSRRKYQRARGLFISPGAILPVSAIIEMTAVTLFAINLLVAFIGPATHLNRVHSLDHSAAAPQ